jgi:hypothetical protein
MKPAKRRCNGIRRVKVKEEEKNESSPNNTAAASPASPGLSHFAIPPLTLPVLRKTAGGESID